MTLGVLVHAKSMNGSLRPNHFYCDWIHYAFRVKVVSLFGARIKVRLAHVSFVSEAKKDQNAPAAEQTLSLIKWSPDSISLFVVTLLLVPALRFGHSSPSPADLSMSGHTRR